MDKTRLLILAFFVIVALSLLFTYRFAEKRQSHIDRISHVLASQEVTIGIEVSNLKGFGKEEALHRLIRSIRKFFPETLILVSNDGKPLKDTRIHQNVQYFQLPFDSGVSYGRNFLVNRTRTKYYLSLDEMFVMKDDSIHYLIEFLWKHPNVDLAGGTISNYEPCDARMIKLANGTLAICKEYERFLIDANCYYTDLVSNFFLAKTEFLHKNRWDNDLKLGEKIPFFLQAKERGGVVAFCPLARVDYQQLGEGDFTPFRNCEYQFPQLAKYNISETIQACPL